MMIMMMRSLFPLFSMSTTRRARTKALNLAMMRHSLMQRMESEAVRSARQLAHV